MSHDGVDYNTEYRTVWESNPYLKVGFGPKNHRTPGKNYWLHLMPLMVKKENGKLIFKQVKSKHFKPSYRDPGHLKITLDTRYHSLKQQMLETDRQYGLKNFDWIVVQVSDGPNKHPSDYFQGIKDIPAPVVIPCSMQLKHDYKYVVPDPTFWDWPQAKIRSYKDATETLSINGDAKVDNYIMGWRGTGHYGQRKLTILKYQDNPFFNFKASSAFALISTRYVPDKNFIHLYDQVKMWRYFLDLRGATYSSRTKYLLFSKRVVFAQKFTFKEWFYTDLKPWVHYVPVSEDLSDLETNYQIIRDSPRLEQTIIENAYQFAINNITFDHALQRWHTVINNL